MGVAGGRTAAAGEEDRGSKETGNDPACSLVGGSWNGLTNLSLWVPPCSGCY